MLKLTILGCGASAGVPSIGNHWGQCDPNEPKNRRSRPSVVVQSETTTVIVDTGPDFREQINRTDIKKVDAVLYTHSHGDHIFGMDDLRPFRMRHKRLIDIYAMHETIDDLKKHFDYIFRSRVDIYPQVVIPHFIEPQAFGRPLTIGDVTVVPFLQDHGTCTTLGFRFGNLGYSTDMIGLDDGALDTLKGIDTWIVDGAGYRMEKSMVHATLKQIYTYNERVGARQVYLTHMTPSMDYATLLKELPSGYAPAYDGLTIEINDV